jgi:hypothetical protein
MNNQHRENLRRVADALDVVAKFDMHFWYLQRSCGTACCVGGTAALILFPDVHRADVPESDVGKRLGLSAEASEALFYPAGGENGTLWPPAYYPEGGSPYDATAEQAANLLRDITDGKVVFDEDARRFVVAESPA